MSLEVNRNDASIDTREIPKGRKTFTRGIAGILTTIALFSGSLLGPTPVYAQTITSQTQSLESISPSTVIEIPEEYKYTVYNLCEKKDGEPITVGDLQNSKDMMLTISVTDGASLEWLNYVGKIDYLTLIIKAEDTSILQTIKNLKNVSNIIIVSALNSLTEINNDDYQFLKDSKNIRSLSITGDVAVEPGFLEQLTHLKKISFSLLDGNHYDLSKLDFLDEIELYEPYTDAIYITTDEYNYLTSKGVKITFSDEEDLEKFKEINNRLDKIVASLNLDQNSTEQERLDAILCYVLDNLEYDSEVSRILASGENSRGLSKSFYTDGLLYGALEKDTAICGNYAALTNALAERLDINTYYLTSASHAWSLVEVEGNYYYVDATWLDGQVYYEDNTTYEYNDQGLLVSQSTIFEPVSAAEKIRNKETEELEWYMEDPTSYPKSENQRESHIVINLPSYFGINPQEETEESVDTILPEQVNNPTETTLPEETQKPISLDNKEVELRLGNKSWIIPGAAAIGVLTALGGAITVKKKKEKESRERRRRAMKNGLYSKPVYGSSSSIYDDFDFDSPFGESNSSNKRYR